MNRRSAFLHSQKNALINPCDADARYQLGLIYLKGKSYPNAEKYFREAIQIEPDNPEYHFALARIFHRYRNYSDAISKYIEVLEMNPNIGYGDIQLRLGNCYLKLKQLENAKYWFEKAIEHNSSLAEAYFKLALVQDRMGNKNLKEILLKQCRSTAANSPTFLQKRNRYWGWAALFYPLISIFY